MNEDLSAATGAQLARWAYGRATTPDEQARALLAAAELQRRAAAARERAHLDEAGQPAAETPPHPLAIDEFDDTSNERPASILTDSERSHHRRMRATGILGVVAALLSLGPISLELTRVTENPMAIFDRAPTQLDQEWAERLAQDPTLTVTAGPRVIDLGSGRAGIAVRLSTVPDGRSTEWDAYCLLNGAVDATGGGWSLTFSCTTPPEFSITGLATTLRTSVEGEGFDVVAWGPVGGPRIDTNVARAPDSPATTALGSLMIPGWRFDTSSDWLAIVPEPERLLAGPNPALSSLPPISGADVAVNLYLLAGEREHDEPELCMHAEHARSQPTTSCRPLADAQTSGLFVLMAIADENWIVSVDATGTVSARQSLAAMPG